MSDSDTFEPNARPVRHGDDNDPSAATEVASDASDAQAAPADTEDQSASAPESLEPAILVYDTHDPQPAPHPAAEAIVADNPVDIDEPAVDAEPATAPMTDEALAAAPAVSSDTAAAGPEVEAVAASAAAMAVQAAPSPEPAPTAPAEPVSATRPIWSDEGDAPFDENEVRQVRNTGGDAARSSGGGFLAEVFDIARTIVYALLIALVLRVLFFQPFTIPSASMEPNLYEGDYIVVSKWTYGYSRHSAPFSPPVFEGRLFGSAPERGDIVVFKLPRDDRTDYIKRVIGLPGDRVQMRGGVLYINDEAVPNAVVDRREVEGIFYPESTVQARETLPGGRSYVIQDFGPNQMLDETAVFEVPAGHYFMMGDNRDNSIDSRVSEDRGVGLVPEENLVGRAEMILFSWEPGATLFNPLSWFSNARWDRFFTSLQ